MLTVRKSGKHPIGSRTRAAGYEGKSGWNKLKAGEAIAVRKDWDPSHVPPQSARAMARDKKEKEALQDTLFVFHSNLLWMQSI
jgi:hypothetical protein